MKLEELFEIYKDHDSYNRNVINDVEKYWKPSECSCDKCKAMCKRCPCLSTPEDVLRIIKALGRDALDKFKKTENMFYMTRKLCQFPLLMIQAENTEFGCIFLKGGKCEIHTIKPTEGIYSKGCHNEYIGIDDKKKLYAMMLCDSNIRTALSWCTRDPLIGDLFRVFGAEESEIDFMYWNNYEQGKQIVNTLMKEGNLNEEDVLCLSISKEWLSRE